MESIIFFIFNDFFINRCTVNVDLVRLQSLREVERNRAEAELSSNRSRLATERGDTSSSKDPSSQPTSSHPIHTAPIHTADIKLMDLKMAEGVHDHKHEIMDTEVVSFNEPKDVNAPLSEPLAAIIEIINISISHPGTHVDEIKGLSAAQNASH